MSIQTKELLKTEGDQLLTVPEAAEIAGTHAQTIRRWIYGGHLKAQKGGGKYGRFRILRADLMDALEYDPENLHQTEKDGK